eukprot:g62327.t1
MGYLRKKLARNVLYWIFYRYSIFEVFRWHQVGESLFAFKIQTRPHAQQTKQSICLALHISQSTKERIENIVSMKNAALICHVDFKWVVVNAAFGEVSRPEMGSKVDIKCVMVGNASVGKSSLMERYLYDKFNDKISTTVGAAFAAKEVESSRKPGLKAVVGLWDTAGSERYESMTRHYFQGASAAVVCYDLTDAKTWTKVQTWVKNVREVEPQCMVVLVGCKADLLAQGVRRAVSEEEVKQYADTLDAKVFSSSALSGEGCSGPFQYLVDHWLEHNKPRSLQQGAGERKVNRTFRLDPESKPGLLDNCCGSGK